MSKRIEYDDGVFRKLWADGVSRGKIAKHFGSSKSAISIHAARLGLRPRLGSGLGLSMVQGFVKQSGGAIRVYSEVGVGTTFKLYFKAAELGSSKTRKLREEKSPMTDGSASVLIAEDEDEVMRILSRILRDAGYAVTTAVSGDEALEVFRASGPFDLLLTDVVMPGELLGPALAKAARQLNPDLPCIFLSGYASEATVHGNGLRPSDIRLMKPVGRTDLLNAVSKAISKAKKNG